MKRLFFLVWISLPFQMAAQYVLNPEWQKNISSPLGENALAWGLNIDQNNNLFWAVNIDSISGKRLDVLCYKFDVNGNELWTTPFFYSMDSIQRAYVCNVDDSTLYLGGQQCYGLFDCDMLLLKVDKSTGTLIWDAVMDFGNDGYDEIDGLEIMDDGIYCGGWAQALESGNYNTDIGLWKLDFNGNTEWTNYFGESGGLAEHQDGHFVVDNNTIFATGLWNGDNYGNLQNGHSFLGTFSKSDGSFIDSTLFGSQSYTLFDTDNALGMTSDGTYLYITGYTIPVNASDWQIFVAKYDKNLNQIWYTTWGGAGTESARAIQVHDNKIYIAGRTESAAYSVNSDKKDGVLLQYDLDGNLMSYHSWGSDSTDKVHDLVVTDNNIYITGSKKSATTNKNSAYLLKVNRNTLSVTSNSPITPKIDIYPNPAIGLVNIAMPAPIKKDVRVTVSNLQGKVIQQHTLKSDTQTHSLQLESKGVLLLHLENESFSVTKKIVNL